MRKQKRKMHQYKRDRLIAEMQRLFTHCFGSDVITLSNDEAIRRIKKRRKRGTIDAQEVLQNGVRLSFAERLSSNQVQIRVLPF